MTLDAATVTVPVCGWGGYRQLDAPVGGDAGMVPD